MSSLQPNSLKDFLLKNLPSSPDKSRCCFFRWPVG
ncbi:unnamed protein product [Spirodela intermedia]|uniref:Uncharacterized protein n=1 Tax=Spirodela intermedia TaxID=51605 RepID=A0A7I8L903_SPIIN|nr:unnamed protein product [Spirodela intermedia]